MDPYSILSSEFRSLGYSPMQVAGILGRLTQESSLRPTVVGDTGKNGFKAVPGGSFGIGQWNRDRLTGPNGLIPWSNRNDLDHQDLRTQARFLDWELKNSERYAGNKIMNATDLAGVVEGMMDYERPAGYTRKAPRGGHGFANSLKYAQGYAKRTPGVSLPNYGPPGTPSPVSSPPSDPAGDGGSTSMMAKMKGMFGKDGSHVDELGDLISNLTGSDREAPQVEAMQAPQLQANRPSQEAQMLFQQLLNQRRMDTVPGFSLMGMR